MRPRPSLYSRAPWAVWVWLGTATVALLLVLLLPGWSDPWYVSYHGIAYLGAVVLAIGAAFTRGTTAIVWWLLTGYQALNATGDLVYYREVEALGEVISPGWSDAIYLVASIIGVAALLILLWTRRTPADPVALIDTAIMVVALAAILGVFVIVPALDGSEVRAGALVVAFAYPLLDLAVLAGIVRILFGGAFRNTSLVLVATSFAAYLGIDVIYSVLRATETDPGLLPWVDAWFIAAGVIMVAAVLVPGAGRITHRERAVDHAEPGRIRLAWVSVGVLTAPVLLFVVLEGTSLVIARLLVVATIVVLVLALLRLRILLRTIDDQSRELARQARTDSLTGLPNRRAWDAALAETARTSDQAGTALAIAVLDLDLFKQFNDRHGHLAGDEHLIAFARAGTAVLGAEGQMYRIGGEEFGVLVPERPGVDVDALLGRVRLAVPEPETASMGVARRIFGENPFDAVQRADRALYAAKEAGRDRLLAHPGPGATPLPHP